MTTPPNLPSQVGVAGSAPPDVLSIANFLAQFVQSVNGWISQAGNALNWLLGSQQGRVFEAGITSTQGFSTTTVNTWLYSGFSIEITPKYTGRLSVTGTAQLANASASTNYAALFVGTQTLPAMGAAMVGSQFGLLALTDNPVTQNQTVTPTGIVAVAPGPTYWIALALQTSVATLTSNWLGISAVEI